MAPLNSGGSASATSLFEAGHRPQGGPAFTHVSAFLFARSPKVTFTRVLQRICYLLRRPGCFRPSDRLAGWDSHPLKIADFHGVLVYWDVSLTAELIRTKCHRGIETDYFFSKSSTTFMSFNASVMSPLIYMEPSILSTGSL